MLAQVITLIRFMEELSDHTFTHVFKSATESVYRTFKCHETIKIKENLDTRVSSLRISW